MTSPHEREPQPGRTKETPQFTPIEQICHGVEIVRNLDGKRQYHVMYERGTFESPLLAHYFFATADLVLHNLERVIQQKLGMLIKLPTGDRLTITGDAQKMSDLSKRIANLAGWHVSLTTYDESLALKGEIDTARKQLGRVRNPYKVGASKALGVASKTASPKTQLDALLEANVHSAEKMSEDLRIAQSILDRWRKVFAKRNREVEGPIVKKYYELAKGSAQLQQGDLNANAREQAARHVSGQEGLVADLNKITWPEYWQRIQDPDVQRLREFGAHIRAGNDTVAAKILEGAIRKLWRVVEERQKRQRGEREK